MNGLRFLSPHGAVVVALLLAAPHIATAATYNVSQTVLGVAEPLPANGGFQLACGSACRYASASGAQMANGAIAWPGAFAMASWPVHFTSTAPQYASVDDTLAVPAAPAGTQYDTLGEQPWQRAQVAWSYLSEMPASARQLDVQTWRSGTGASAVSYAVRINTPADGARRTYLSFEVPTSVRAWKYAGYIGGPSGQQPYTVLPNRMQARTAVDVYVDGLPVWSSQSMRLRPKRHGASGAAPFDLDWGDALDGSQATLFLGTLPAGSSRTAVIVMRADLRVDAPSCYTLPDPAFDDERRCNAHREGLALPGSSVAPLYLKVPAVTVYTK